MRKATILVADDEAGFLTIMTDFLEGRGYFVLKASNGSEAYRIARSRRPDLIILDISMPLMDGGEAAQKLLETADTRDIPIIFLSGLLSKENETNVNHMIGGRVMYAKPCNFEDILKRIELLLGVSAEDTAAGVKCVCSRAKE